MIETPASPSAAETQGIEPCVQTRYGWLLDIYEDAQHGVTIWFINTDGQRQCLSQPFPVTFYVAGPAASLRALWRFLEQQPEQVRLARARRRDIFAAQPLDLLSVQVQQPAAQPALFKRTAAAFPDLIYYDADIPIQLRHAARFGTFSLAYCQVTADHQDVVQDIRVLDSPWELDPEIVPLHILSLEPDVDPAHAPPSSLRIRTRERAYRLDFNPARPFLINLRSILQRHDPDLLLTVWGDTWLLPYLLELSERWQIPLPLNRDPRRDVSYRKERSYFTYGQVIYRGQQVHLFGRWHIDGNNAMLFHDYGMEGIFELARVTSLPGQTVARVSPGSGISAMQMVTAMRQGILVPWHKQQAEELKTALELFHADQGGLVYQPLIGLHQDVAEIDFISMYPSIMVHFNISPETVGSSSRSQSDHIPELELYIDRDNQGLIPKTLAPLLEKRIALKTQMATLPAWHPVRRRYEACASGHKWLLVTCFGYLGYKNARFGRIEAHEAVTAYGREALMRAKEAAEDLGYTVLHMYVDGLWVKKPGAAQTADFQPLLDEILDRTGLPVGLEGVYRWIAFLPSRVDARVPVANRYFGVFKDGSRKVRGIELRRLDTPAFIYELQDNMLTILAEAPQAALLRQQLPEIYSLLRHTLVRLRAGRIPLEKLLVSQKLSRTLAEYRTPSPAARAAAQLASLGTELRPGQRVRFIFTLGEPGVYAWNLPAPPNPAAVDISRYTTLMIRAASTILQPLGVSETALRERLVGNVVAKPRLQLPDHVSQNRLSILNPS